MSSDLGVELKAVRRLRRLSLKAVAGPAKISAAYLQKLEAGVVKNPSPPVLHRLSAVLDVSYSRLMELAGYILPEPGRGKGAAEGSLLAQAIIDEELTDDELRAVSAFISYLKDGRENR